jgi:hypothetical protein
MSSRNLVTPFFPVAPQAYDAQYMEQIVRAFSLFIEQNRNPGEGRNTFAVFTDLQTDDYGLELGSIFNYGGYVKITQENAAHVRGLSGISAIGSVTVTTT